MQIFKKKINELRFNLGKKILKKGIKEKDFTLISNDCWGGELYKLLDLPYNTPFIGCMLMAPCYLKLLENLELNLKSPLTFINKSKYEEINILRKEKGYFPIALIHNSIEIQFLHYISETEVLNKWQRRVNRINFDKIYVKFDIGKDYANAEMVTVFNKLYFKNKLMVYPSAMAFKDKVENGISISNYNKNGAILFYKTLMHLDLIKWLELGVISNPKKYISFLIKFAFGNIIKI